MHEGCTGAAAVRWNYDDVNGDGLLDLVFFFRLQELSLTIGNTEVMLMAHDENQMHIMGMTSVLIKP